MSEYKNDRKLIKGYSCHRIRLLISLNDDDSYLEALGDQVIEMYVTRSIKLPLYALIAVNEPLQGLFPLEMREWLEKLPEIVTVTRVSTIE